MVPVSLVEGIPTPCTYQSVKLVMGTEALFPPWCHYLGTALP